MWTTASRRRGLGAVFVATAVGAFAWTLTAPNSATAAQDPCSASEVAKTIGGVATSTGNYLDSHPPTNQALTRIAQQQPGPQSLAALKSYFDANPQAGKDMQLLQTPLVSLSTRCNLPLTPSQVLGLLQQAQPQNPSLPVTSPGVAAAQGTGPLPGPVTGTTR